MKDISRVLQKNFNCFNGAIISAYSISPSSSVWPVIFLLELNQ